MKINLKVSCLWLALILSLPALKAEVNDHPPIWGIAKMTFRVSDFDIARAYYGRFLGFEEAFSYESVNGKVISFKVNDRQYIEFIHDPDTRQKTRLVSVSLETSDVEAMRNFLASSGWKVPQAITDDGAGNRVFTVKDSSGNSVEFIEYHDKGLHRLSKGLYLSERRISSRIHHAGIFTRNVTDSDPFYSEVLQFQTILRYPEDKSVKPVMIYYGMVNCTESIEHYASDDINISHPCFLVNDMQETVYTLKERNGGQLNGKPMIGRGKRWILNLNNPDGTKVEFTEAYTVR